METNNPYSAPIEKGAEAFQSNQPLATEATFGSIAKQTFLAWEKLRLLYIGILGAVTLCCYLPNRSSIGLPDILFTAIGGAIFANVCYFVAPMIETYIKWLGVPTSTIRIVLFATGTLFASALAVYVLLSLASV